jgi:hypothetical protein
MGCYSSTPLCLGLDSPRLFSPNNIQHKIIAICRAHKRHIEHLIVDIIQMTNFLHR